ncbi:MAG TPA: response regulator [Pseudomonadales bacterium]|nr:response regulator [Pseudomonadales bacterium]
MSARDYLSPNDVARMLKVSPITVRQWASRGLIEATTTAGGHRRFTMDAVRRFASERGIVLPREAGGPVRRVLVVDDDRQLNRFLVELVNAWSRRMNADLKVDSAFDGFEAGAKVHTFDPDVVLLDLMMPGVDGFEVCRRLKSDATTCHMRVVAMTGYYSPDRVQKILATGADRFLRKPFANSEVLEACGLVQAAAAPVREAVAST